MGGKTLHKYGKKLFISHGVLCACHGFCFCAPLLSANSTIREEMNNDEKTSGKFYTGPGTAELAAYTRQQQLLAETAAAETEAIQALAERLAA